MAVLGVAAKIGGFWPWRPFPQKCHMKTGGPWRKAAFGIRHSAFGQESTTPFTTEDAEYTEGTTRESHRPVCDRLKFKIDLPYLLLPCAALAYPVQVFVARSGISPGSAPESSKENMKPAFILLLVLASICAEAKVPSSAWKGGVLKRVTKEHIAKQSGELGKKPPRHGVYISYYFIEADNSLYEGDDVKLKNNEKGFPVSVDAPVKFFLSGSDMYVQDDRGKAHKLRLVNVLTTQTSAPQSSSADAQK